ncbi:MAG: aspartate/glutamate racemase family protein [Cyanobacteria bacterium]|nr:aspartate/glutamate racemase family protein [Cyanobacteriota bacterium]
MALSSHKNLGCFDSGVGGLSVISALLVALDADPASFTGIGALKIVYIGDTAYVPYGEKSVSVITERVALIMDCLQRHHQVDAVLVACNTSASTVVIPERLPVFSAAEKLSGPTQSGLILDTIRPIAASADLAQYKRLAVMATPLTVGSGQFTQQIHYHHPDIEVLEIACPGLAAAIETDTPAEWASIDGALGQWAEQIQAFQAEALILGCTHYPFAVNRLKALLLDEIQLLDPATYMVDALLTALEANNTSFDRSPDTKADVSVQIFVTGDPALFQQTASTLAVHPRLKQAIASTQSLGLMPV